MKHLAKLVTLLALCITGGLTVAQTSNMKKEIDWDLLGSAWEEYVNNPTEDNAFQMYRILPNDGHVSKENKDKSIETSIIRNLNIIQQQIRKESVNSTRLAFRLFTISDGYFSEELQVIIGELITINPELFLTELDQHLQLVMLPNLLCNIDYRKYDNVTSQKLEAVKRIESLKTIDDCNLAEIKWQCICELNKFLDNLSN